LINQDKIDEWIREVEERPVSAPIILRYIAARIMDLAQQNEELRAENLELRTGSKVEAYESRLANLEYQIELLKRQVGDQISQPAAESLSILIYNQAGQVMRIETPAANITAGDTAGSFELALTPEIPVRLLITGSHEELLFVFDSGRTITHPVSSIPTVSSNNMDWEHAFLQEPVGSEKLAAIVAVARMSLVESVVQCSLRGFVKRMMRSFFENQLAKNYIGTGVKQQPDKSCGLTLVGKDALFSMVSREGYLFSVEPEQLPFAIEEAIRLRATDYIVSSFAVNQGDSIVVVTNNGKVIHRDFTWLEPFTSFRSKGQALFSQVRREAGIKVAGAAAANEHDWGAVLLQDGRVCIYKMKDLYASGSIPATETDINILDFTVFQGPNFDQT
jgi:DNA gyrase/topoisomerase IV subunit A